jgi:hypothetical protein
MHKRSHKKAQAQAQTPTAPSVATNLQTATHTAVNVAQKDKAKTFDYITKESKNEKITKNCNLNRIMCAFVVSSNCMRKACV